jgi:glutamate/tyrosine decarboxylase-like PLP-dependent enzyme
MALYADYFNREGEVEPNPGLKSMPSTRPFAALNLVTSLRHQGMNHVRQNLHAPLHAIRTIASYIESQSDLELCHRPDTGILCFRITPAGFSENELDALQKYVYDSILAGGQRSISMTKLDGRTVLRFLVISPQVTSEILQETISVVRALAEDYQSHP